MMGADYCDNSLPPTIGHDEREAAVVIAAIKAEIYEARMPLYGRWCEGFDEPETADSARRPT